MSIVTVSVTCPNCGCPVVLTLDTAVEGGFVACCYNCSANVSGSYSWSCNGGIRFFYIRSSGGAKKR